MDKWIKTVTIVFAVIIIPFSILELFIGEIYIWETIDLWVLLAFFLWTIVLLIWQKRKNDNQTQVKLRCVLS